MKVLLGTLALLPIIASHVYLQLPQFPAGSPAIGQRHYGASNINHNLLSPREEGNDNEESLSSSAVSSHLPGELTAETDGNDREDSQRKDFQPSNNHNLKYSMQNHLPLLSESHFEQEMAKTKTPGNPEELAMAGEMRLGAPSSLRKYFQPSAHIYHPMYQHTLSGRPLGLLARLPNQRFYDASLLASLKSSAQDVVEGGPRAPPSKRYLGIELPDYIASNYAGLKTGNQQLHQLKQRMRSVGK